MVNQCNFVSWNCLSCYPHHYMDINEKKNIEESLTKNNERYQFEIQKLEPYLEKLNKNEISIICLQEVDPLLLSLLETCLSKKYKNIKTSPNKYPYVWINDIYRYHLVTLFHKKEVSPLPQITYSLGNRFRSIKLKNITIINTHLNWLPDNASKGNIDKMTTLLNCIKKTITNCMKERKVPVVILGDLNLSSIVNTKLYTKIFKTMNIYPLGESYNLRSSEGKTFADLECHQDDGIIIPKELKLSVDYEKLSDYKLPIKKNKDFCKMYQTIYPSDHALIEGRIYL